MMYPVSTVNSSQLNELPCHLLVFQMLLVPSAAPAGLVLSACVEPSAALSRLGLAFLYGEGLVSQGK
jgi:hypothetical protein